MEYTIDIFAESYQFYIQDDDIVFGDLADAWTKDASDRWMALAQGAIGIRTARNTKVSVTISILDYEPRKVLDCDRVNDCEIQINTGRIVVAGWNDFYPNALRISCAPGPYRVRVVYKNLTDISHDGQTGRDSYQLYLWPELQSESHQFE